MVTQAHIPQSGTNKEDKGQRSSCKAEGATSQILVANARKCSILQVTLTFEKSSMQIVQLYCKETFF